MIRPDKGFWKHFLRNPFPKLKFPDPRLAISGVKIDSAAPLDGDHVEPREQQNAGGGDELFRHWRHESFAVHENWL